MKHHAPITRRKPWAEKYQTATAVTILVALITSVIVGIGYLDGYWSNSASAIARMGR